MRIVNSHALRLALCLLVNALMITSLAAQQTDRLLRPAPGAGTPVIPFMEGWYAKRTAR